MNFPSSPTVGQRVELGALVWTWNGSAWDLNSNYGQVGTQIFNVLNFVDLSVEGWPMIDGSFETITYV